jgi:hypothetical protein
MKIVSIKDIIISEGLQGVIYSRPKASAPEPPENKGGDGSLRYCRNYRTQAKLIGCKVYSDSLPFTVVINPQELLFGASVDRQVAEDP